MLKITQINLIRIINKEGEDKVLGKFNITWEDGEVRCNTLTFTDGNLVNDYEWRDLILNKVNVQIKLVADEQNPKYFYVDASAFIKDNKLVKHEPKEQRQSLADLLVG